MAPKFHKYFSLSFVFLLQCVKYLLQVCSISKVKYQTKSVINTLRIDISILDITCKAFVAKYALNTFAETFLDESVSSLYHSAIVTEELLLDTNKYWCEQCRRYNEARRSVRYETLPRLLILQLKRFKSTYGLVLLHLIHYSDFVLLPHHLFIMCCFVLINLSVVTLIIIKLIVIEGLSLLLLEVTTSFTLYNYVQHVCNADRARSRVENTHHNQLSHQ